VRTVVFGGAGFVGLNLTEALLARGGEVVIFDRTLPPEAALEAFSKLPGRLSHTRGDVTDLAAIEATISGEVDAIVFGTAITADARRDATEPDRILEVNLLSLVPILSRARDIGVRRLINLSSAAAYGTSAFRDDPIAEETCADPVSLYAITKFASERVGARLADLWKLDVRSVRLSAVFGPWERATGVRDTLSPHMQILAAAERGEPALLGRPGFRDWVYSVDVAEALLAVLDAGDPPHRIYNISSSEVWPVLAWGERLAAGRSGFACRLAEAGETPTIDLHGALDRAPLATDRIRQDLGWSPRYDMESSVKHLDQWWRERASSSGLAP
jgi:UDP-glucose 4-epimerase